jgi:hypothetical protein
VTARQTCCVDRVTLFQLRQAWCALCLVSAGALGCGTEPDACPDGGCPNGGVDSTDTPFTSDALFFRSDRTGAGDIYVMRPNGTGLLRLTSAPEPETGPSISHDRTRLAYLEVRSVTVGVILNLATADTTHLGEPTFYDSKAYPIVWSPRDTSVAAMHYSPRSALNGVQVFSTATGRMLTFGGSHWDGHPRWLPMGDTLLLNHDRFHGDFRLELWDTRLAYDAGCEAGPYPAACTSRVQLTRDPEVRKIDPTVVSTGEWIAVTRRDTLVRLHRPTLTWQVVTGPVSGEGPIELRWSPTGEWIAFVAAGDVYVVRPDGEQLRNVSAHAALDTEPTWAPDGTRLAFTSERDGNREIYVVNVDGTGLRNLTHHPAMDELPNWAPIQ